MRTVLFFCFALLYNLLFAQGKTFTGFYITTNGDTVKGSFPRYNQWSKNPEKVEFKPARNSGSIQLTPFNCLKFFIDNYDEYISYSGKRLINPIEDNIAIDNREYFDFNYKDSNVVVFLRLVTKNSQCGIYVLNDKIRTNFFYQLPGQPLQELKYKKYYDGTSMHELTEYRQQLKNLFTREISQKKLAGALEELPYSEDGIVKFFQKLFSVKKRNTFKKNASAGWLINGGVSINSLNTTGDDLIETQVNYSTTYAPYLSLGYFAPFQRNFSRYFIYPQVRFSSYKNSGEKTGSSFVKQVTFQSSLSILSELNIGVHLINKENFHFFMYSGAGIMMLINNKEIYKFSVYTPGEYKLSSQVAAVNLSTGILLKNKIQFLITYALPTNINNSYGFAAKQSSVQIGIGYKFNKR